jgi:hypothetical protein
MKTNLNAIYHHPGMQALRGALGRQDHRTLVLWALETGQEILDIFTLVFPDDPRPTAALEAAEAWSRGEIKMPAAKTAARETHEAAKEAKSAEDVEKYKRDAAAAVAHAMGQIIGVVHVGTHSTAYAAYWVQAVTLFNHGDDPEETLENVAARLEERLDYWAAAPKDQRPWARFL